MSESDDVVATMRQAITVVRHEGYKAAFIAAVFDGTITGLGVLLTLTIVRIHTVPPAYLAVATGLVAGTASFAARLRRPLVERFEAVNPEVHEALRTARDALNDDDTSTMARALYANVIDRLQETSSIKLLNPRRLGLRFVILFALSIAVIQASLLGVNLGAGPTGPPGGNGNAGAPSGPTPTPVSLQPGDDVLGDPTTVTPGGENLSAVIDRQIGTGDDREQREYETGGLDPDTTVEAERADYAPPDDIENADLIREYNLRIREETDDGS